MALNRFLFFSSALTCFVSYVHCKSPRALQYLLSKQLYIPLLSRSFLYLASSIILFRNGVTSNSYNYGIIRIYDNDDVTATNICDDDSYSKNEADVICHQLGYIGASSYSRAGLVRLVKQKMANFLI